MVKKGKPSTRIIVVVIALVAVSALVVVAWHDGLIGVTLTPMGYINNRIVTSGPVTVKGEITQITGTVITVEDWSGGLIFTWAGPATLHSIVVVRGVIADRYYLQLVSSVDVVWLFR